MSYWTPRHDIDYLNGSEFPVPTPVPFYTDHDGKFYAMDYILEQYYEAIDNLHLEEATDQLRLGLPHLAALHMLLAELRPFKDANSRIRTLVLQTELVRLGGHPVVMENYGWQIYGKGSVGAHILDILEGWCAWEAVVATGKSPFVSASPYAPFYNSTIGECRIGA